MTRLDVRGLWLLVILLAEALTVFAGPIWGIIAYFLLLFFIILGASAVKDSPANLFYVALGLVPLIRITNLSLPVADLSPWYAYLITAIPILVGVVAVAITLRLKPADLGLTARELPLQVLIAMMGIGLGILDYLVIKPEPMTDTLSVRSILFPALILLVAIGFVEELVFRGVLQRCAQALGIGGWIYVALIATVLQLGYRSPWHALLALATALLYGWIVKKTGSISGIAVSHGLASICLYLVAPHIF